jgi:hypothetical protein
MGAEPAYEYGSSVLATLGGVVLVVFGLIALLLGGVVTVIGFAVDVEEVIEQANLSGEAARIFRDVWGIIIGVGVGVLVVAILHIVSGIGVWAHKSWARFLGALFGLLGSVLGALAVYGALAGPQVTGDGTTIDLEQNLIPSLVFFIAYLVVFLGLLVGGKHFRQEPIE